MREQSRTNIQLAAMRLFARHGYENTSVRMIAEEAGIAQGLLYNYYTGKEALLLDVFARSMEDVRHSFGAMDGANADQSIALLIRASFAIVREHLDFWRLTYSLRTQPSLMALLGEAVGGWTSEIIGTLETHLGAAGVANPPIEAAILFATIDGVSQHYALAPDSYPLDAVVDALITRYSKGDALL